MSTYALETEKLPAVNAATSSLTEEDGQCSVDVSGLTRWSYMVLRLPRSSTVLSSIYLSRYLYLCRSSLVSTKRIVNAIYVHK